MAIRKSDAATYSPLMPLIDPRQIGPRVPAGSSPEQRLAAAVVQQAIDDARGNVSGVSYPVTQRKIAGESQAWLQDTAAANAIGGATWSVAYCCEVLGWNPERIAAGVAASLANPSHAPRFRRRVSTRYQRGNKVGGTREVAA